MPDLDVAFVLDDPMFRDDTITLQRTTLVPGPDGRGVPTTVTFPIEGVAISGYALPGGDGGLVRRPEGETNTNGMTLVTKFKVEMGDAILGTTSDVIIWNESAFTVVAQNAYNNFGEGFWLILADQLPLNPPPT
ncbi:hypothetical protein [Bosea sp. AS-1]|uniref:hypothetical protein n=1 Tax=Bosea sp. AS-1 TaxID=2015316 RepID=UPI000B78BB77|nr:hypothetical protein [Bosea sp. AS-1]